MNKIIVTDMGGVLYSYDSSFNPDKHQNMFDDAMKIFGRENDPLKLQLKGEFEGVEKRILKIYPVKGAVDKLKRIGQSYKIVVVSTSLVKTSKYILDKIGLSKIASKIYDMSDYGSKKDSMAWKEIFRKLLSVDVIVEDSDKNLEAAKSAAEELGFSPRVFSQLPSKI